MTEIAFALSDKVDVSMIANTELKPEQMKQISNGLSNLPQDKVVLYADLKFNSKQMYQIRLGLEKNIDVSAY